MQKEVALVYSNEEGLLHAMTGACFKKSSMVACRRITFPGVVS